MMLLFDATEYQGLRLKLAWNELHVGFSFFIPCLDTESMLRVIYSEAERRGYKLIHSEVIENGMSGIRYWRVNPSDAPQSGEPS